MLNIKNAKLIKQNKFVTQFKSFFKFTLPYFVILVFMTFISSLFFF